MQVRPGSRRLLALLVVLYAVAPGCEPSENANRRAIRHVLDRVAYGPDPWTLQRVQELGGIYGLRAFIEEQLHPEQLDDTALEAEIADLYPVETMTYGASRQYYNEYTGVSDPGPSVPRRDATRAKVLRAVKSKRQLEQVLVDFWFNHFNVDTIGEARWGFLTLERDAIRPYVFGKFENMLRATVKNPGMLDYLDNARNFKTGYIYLGLKRGINENYSRELLELHTVGVDAPYTQADVVEVARALTGWTTSTALIWEPDGFHYQSPGHDTDAKSVMGALELPAGRQMVDGTDLIHFLAQRPETAARVARKLCQRFVAEAPPQALVDRAAQTFLATDGDLREVMRTILLSQEFLGTQYVGIKVKRPLVFVASLARAIGIADDAAFAQAMDGKLQLLAEGLYRAGPPTGYPDVSSFWAGEGPFVQRMNLAWDATHANLGFGPLLTVTATTPEGIVNALQARYLPTGIGAPEWTRLVELAGSLPASARPAEVAATLFMSPAFLLH